MANEFFLVAWEHIDDRDFNHGVGSWLLLHGCTCHVDEDLCGEGRVVDFHVEFEQLIVSLATDTLANEVHAMADVVERVNGSNLLDVGFVVHEIRVSLDGLGNGVEIGTFFEFDMKINNPALTAQVLVNVARASLKQQPGAYTMIEIPVIDMLPGDKEDLIRHLV